MINKGPWGKRWERWLCEVKKKSILSLISSIHHRPFQSQRDASERRGSEQRRRVLLHLRRLAASLHHRRRRPAFKLHPLPCQKLGIGIDSPWRNYSSASVIYGRDKRVGAFAFGGGFFFERRIVTLGVGVRKMNHQRKSETLAKSEETKRFLTQLQCFSLSQTFKLATTGRMSTPLPLFLSPHPSPPTGFCSRSLAVKREVWIQKVDHWA